MGAEGRLSLHQGVEGHVPALVPHDGFAPQHPFPFAAKFFRNGAGGGIRRLDVEFEPLEADVGKSPVGQEPCRVLSDMLASGPGRYPVADLSDEVLRLDRYESAGTDDLVVSCGSDGEWRAGSCRSLAGGKLTDEADSVLRLVRHWDPCPSLDAWVLAGGEDRVGVLRAPGTQPEGAASQGWRRARPAKLRHGCFLPIRR